MTPHAIALIRGPIIAGNCKMLLVTIMLAGALLGLRFKVFVLVPAIIVCSAATFCDGTAHHDNLWSISLMTALAIAVLQLGYLGGTIISTKSARSLPDAQQSTRARSA